jgi:hypothetical protein
VTAGSLGDINATSTGGTGIGSSHFVAAQGIGNINSASSDNAGFPKADGILNSTFRAGAGIASITASYFDILDSTAGAIVDSGFDARGSIGPINSTGSIVGSVFVAGIGLGPGFGVSGAGSFNNTSASNYGFGASTSSEAAQIGAITVTIVDGNIPSLIEQSTFLAGVHGPGLDKSFGTKDDLVPAGSSIGAITSPGGLNTDFLESGNIGTTYLTTDTPVSAVGIGAITVVANNHGVLDSTFTSNAGIGPVNVTLNGIRTEGENAGISIRRSTAGREATAAPAISV